MTKLEKYTDDESHFITRFTTVLIILFLFTLHSILFINPHGRSCLGPPSLLVFGFIGLPLIIFLSILDLIILIPLKAFRWQKLLINLSIPFFTVLFFLLLLNR